MSSVSTESRALERDRSAVHGLCRRLPENLKVLFYLLRTFEWKTELAEANVRSNKRLKVIHSWWSSTATRPITQKTTERWCFSIIQMHKFLNEQNSPSALIYLLCMRSCSTELLISVFLCTKYAVVTYCNYIFLILSHFQTSKKTGLICKWKLKLA